MQRRQLQNLLLALSAATATWVCIILFDRVITGMGAKLELITYSASQNLEVIKFGAMFFHSYPTGLIKKKKNRTRELRIMNLFEVLELNYPNLHLHRD